MLVSELRVVPQLPAWYLSEKWYEQVYAAISTDSTPTSGTSAACSANCFAAGTVTGRDVVVITGGPQLPGQNRFVVTPTIADFLEAPNSTGTSTRVFAATHAPRTATYADTVSTIPR